MSHLKTLASSKALKISKKKSVFTIKPAPGPHGVEVSVPLGILLRDYLKLADNKKEVRYLLNNKDVLVDGRVVRDGKFPVGLFDIVSIPRIEKTYLILLDRNARLITKEIEKKKADTKLCKLTGKTMVKGGKLQLNLHDGRNILVDAKDSKKFGIGGTIILKVPDGEISGFIELAKDKIALITKGRHAGKTGKIVNITDSQLNLESLTTLECDGERVLTSTAYIFIIGDEHALI